MKNRIANKTALITGATSGIGKACAFALAEQGVNLILMARRKERLDALKQALSDYPIQVEVFQLDVRELEAVKALFYGPLADRQIDILINNAGLAVGMGKVDEGSIDDWERMIDTNVKGLLYVSRAVIPGMRRRNAGHVVNIGSMAGGITYPGGNVYCATKSAVHALSEAMNLDLVGTSVRVANIAPGAAETEFSNVRFHGDDEKADAVYEGFQPLSAEDIADLIVYVLNAPAHVNIQHALIMPTAQRSPTVLHRES
ncbi:MAG: SDR family NAD(P)-dependent oxidoreductase [Hydrogenovibrio sp.]|nr:SDR family NAD(P)-dependent oxidoreductase [Hydrogenovibrio sp.]